MTETSIDQRREDTDPLPEATMPGSSLQELYELYRKFIMDMTSENPERRAIMWEQDEFSVWWSNLPPPIRSIREGSFKKGYAACLAEGKAQVEMVLPKYDKPV
jgi:hypothetical protein